MKKLLIATIALAGLGVTAPAMAETYGSIGYSQTDISPFSLNGVTGRFGWNSGVVGVEGEGTLGVSDDTVGTTTVDLKSAYGVYGTLTGAVSPDFSVIGRVGYARTEVDVGAGNIDDSGVAYGVAAEWKPGGGANGIRLDYTQAKFNTSDANTWSLSYVRHF